MHNTAVPQPDTSSTPLVTVAICTFNNASLLEGALEALTRQQGAPGTWDLVVVDNASTDDTPAVIERFRGRFGGRLRSVPESRQGLVFARRRAVAATEAPWIAFIDDDCRPERDWVASLLAFLDGHPDAGAVGGRVVLEWEQAPSEGLLAYEEAFAAQDLGRRAVAVSRLVGAGLAVHRSRLLATGWAETPLLVGRSGSSLGAGDDTEMVVRLRADGHPAWYCPDLELRHVVPSGRISEGHLLQMVTGFGAARPIIAGIEWTRGPLLFWMSYPLRMLRHLAQAAASFLRSGRSLRTRLLWSSMKGEWAGLRYAIFGLDGRSKRAWRRLMRKRD